MTERIQGEVSWAMVSALTQLLQALSPRVWRHSLLQEIEDHLQYLDEDNTES
jgi:hypothetical protein